MKYMVEMEGKQARTVTLGLSKDDIGGLLLGGMIRVPLRQFGVPGKFGQRLYCVVMDSPATKQLQQRKMLPKEWGRLDCVSERHLNALADSGDEIGLPRDRNGICVRLVREHEMALVRQP